MGRLLLDFLRKARLTFFLAFHKKKFNEIEAEDFERRKQESEKKIQERKETGAPAHNPHWVSDVVRRALGHSFFFVATSVVLGCILGFILSYFFEAPPQRAIWILQGVGAALLLWGVLFVRGFEILSWDSGDSLSDRINGWFNRVLHFLGSSIIFCSLAWQILAVH